MIVIKYVNGNWHPSQGNCRDMFLRTYDPDYAGGQGVVEWTSDIEKAMKFATTAEAWMLWRRTSNVRPLRADGQPNRPLTAFTIEVLNEADA